MEPRETELDAWIDFLSYELNAVSVEVNGGFIIVRRYCSNCKYHETNKTKNCFYPSSLGCWQFKFKGGK